MGIWALDATEVSVEEMCAHLTGIREEAERLNVPIYSQMNPRLPRPPKAAPTKKLEAERQFALEDVPEVEQREEETRVGARYRLLIFKDKVITPGANVARTVRIGDPDYPMNTEIALQECVQHGYLGFHLKRDTIYFKARSALPVDKGNFTCEEDILPLMKKGNNCKTYKCFRYIE